MREEEMMITSPPHLSRTPLPRMPPCPSSHFGQHVFPTLSHLSYYGQALLSFLNLLPPSFHPFWLTFCSVGRFQDDIFRFITEALTIPEANDRGFSLTPMAESSQLKVPTPISPFPIPPPHPLPSPFSSESSLHALLS